MTAKYRARAAFERFDGKRVNKGDIVELEDQEADALVDAGWVKFEENTEGEKPEDTAPPVPSEPVE